MSLNKNMHKKKKKEESGSFVYTRWIHICASVSATRQTFARRVRVRGCTFIWSTIWAGF